MTARTDTDRRRRIRRIALLAGAPVLLLTVLYGAKVLSMYAAAYSASSAYVAQDFPGTVQAARGQEPVNIFEPYKAPYNVGVGLAASGDLERARAAFEQALPLAPGLEQCAVRVNLAIVIERLGDAALADDPAAARAFWQEALLVMQEAPEGCRTPEADEVSPDPQQNMEDTVDEEIRRLLEKLQEPPEGTPPPEDPEDTPDESELEDIQEQLDQGAEEREELESGDEGGATGTDRPW